MTHLGLLVESVLDSLALTTDDALVYATTFAETRALEDYLGTFPTPSPLLFQTSIHPSAVQQALIARQKPLTRFWPVTGRQRLVEHALLTAMLEPASRVVLVGAEERGTWMLEQRMASERAFAFAVMLTGDSAGVVGRDNQRERGRLARFSLATAGGTPVLPAFADALADRHPLHGRGATRAWALDWL